MDMYFTRNVKKRLIFGPFTQQARIDDEVHSIDDLTRLLKATNDQLKANTVQMTAMKAGTCSQDIHLYNDDTQTGLLGARWLSIIPLLISTVHVPSYADIIEQPVLFRLVINDDPCILSNVGVCHVHDINRLMYYIYVYMHMY